MRVQSLRLTLAGAAALLVLAGCGPTAPAAAPVTARPTATTPPAGISLASITVTNSGGILSLSGHNTLHQTPSISLILSAQPGKG